MFNRDFYPTPENVISKMLFPVDIRNKTILEPSAGKGNIVDYLKSHGAKDVIACEINIDLARIVSGKCRLVADNFLKLQAEDISHIDMIIMNPPFSAEEDHIIHAWEIAPGGCTIISLCNSSVVRERYSSTSKQGIIHEYIKLYGNSEDFGDCFTDAERRTDASISCIWLYKPKTGEQEFDDFFSLEEDIEQQAEGIMQYNYVRDIVNRYTSAIKLYDQIMPLADQINGLTAPIAQYGIKFGAFWNNSNKSNYNDRQITREEYKKELQKQCWQKLFSDMNMGKYVTSGVQQTINKFVEQQVHIPFTMKNIYRMVEIIVGTHGNRMQQVLVEAFENICSYAWKENCTGGQNWKTNSDYMVNRRFIVPWACQYDTRWPTDYVKLSYSSTSKITDIIRGLCYLTGTKFDEVSSIDDFVRRMSMDWGQWYDWGFFRIRGYKKGTMHFEFADESVWLKFNTEVARIRGWALPGSTKKAGAKSTDISTI